MIEGLDRAGKSTQCEWLCGALEKEGRTIKRIRFPGMCLRLCFQVDSFVESGWKEEVEPSFSG